nr:hypothetical protein [Tanacetum cinerariifolium]
MVSYKVDLYKPLLVQVSVTLEVGAAVASLVGVLELDTHASSEADPLKSSLPPVFVAPMVLPFLCSDDSELDTEIPERHVSPIPHDAMLARWMSRVASRSSSPTTSTLEIPTAPIPPVPSAVDIPIGRLYHNHPGRPSRALTARKSVRPLPSHRLALRYTSHHLDRFTSGSSDHSSYGHCTSDHSSFGHSTLDHSSSRHSTLGHSLSGHTPPVTTIADSSAPSRFIYPPLTRASWYSEAYRHRRSAPLSTMYPPTTFESSVGILLLSHLMDHLVRGVGLIQLLGLGIIFHQRMVLRRTLMQNIKANATAVMVTADIDVKAGIDVGIGMVVDVRVDVEDEVEGKVESSDRGTMEVGVDVVDRVKDIETRQRELEERILIASGERAGLLDRVAQLKNSLTNEWRGSWLLMRQNHAAELVVKSKNQNGDDDDNRNVGANGNINGRGNGDGNGKGNGNGNKGGNGNGNTNQNDRSTMHVAHECTYHDFVKCQPLNFKGTEGLFGVDKMRTIGADAAFAMSWRELMKLMTEVYCLRNEIQKMKFELWNLTMKNNGLAAYTQRFQELTMMCTKMVPEEEDRVEKFIGASPSSESEGSYFFECGRQGHYRNECPKLKNQTHRNKARNKTNKAKGKSYVMGGGEANPDSNSITGTFLLKNHYASMLFDSGADRSFVSTMLKS